MPIALSISFNWSAGHSKRDNGRMADDFVNHINNHLKSKKTESSIENRKALQDEEIKQRRAVQEWAALREWAKKFCDDINQRNDDNPFVFKPLDGNSFEIVSPDKKTIKVKFSSDEISYVSDSNAGSWSSVVNGTEFYFLDSSLAPVHTATMGQAIIKSLLGMRT